MIPLQRSRLSEETPLHFFVKCATTRERCPTYSCGGHRRSQVHWPAVVRVAHESLGRRIRGRVLRDTDSWLLSGGCSGLIVWLAITTLLHSFAESEDVTGQGWRLTAELMGGIAVESTDIPSRSRLRAVGSR